MTWNPKPLTTADLLRLAYDYERQAWIVDRWTPVALAFFPEYAPTEEPTP